MRKVISKTIKLEVKSMPPSVEFIENAIKNEKIEPIRWAIVDIQDNTLTLSISGYDC